MKAGFYSCRSCTENQCASSRYVGRRGGGHWLRVREQVDRPGGEIEHTPPLLFVLFSLIVRRMSDLSLCHVLLKGCIQQEGERR